MMARLLPILGLAFCGFWTPALQASTISLDINIDPQTGFFFLTHADGSVEIDAFPTFPSIAINAGDHLTVHYSFSGSRIRVSDIAPNNNGLEALTFQFLPFGSQITGAVSATVDLLGVQGNLLPPDQIYSSTFGFSGGFAFQVSEDLTHSNFSFDGVDVNLDFLAVGQPFSLDHGLFGVYGGDIKILPVRAPEPTTLALLGIGLAGLGFSRRRVAHRHRLSHSSSTIAAAMQYPKRRAARSSFAMARAARRIASRSSSSASRTTAAATARERTNVGSGGPSLSITRF
jgi:hypothetical protein